METGPAVTAESAAAEAATSAAEVMAGTAPSTETVATPEAPKVKKATDIFGEIESDIKKMTAAERAAAQPREKGKFAKAEGSEPSEGGETVVDEPTAESSEAAAEVPPSDSPEATEPPKPERKYIADFKVTDQEGELEIPDIQVTYKANGKEVTEPLDHVVKSAQWGKYIEAREQENKELREQRIPQYEQTIEQQSAQLSAYVEAYRELLSNEQAYLQARQEYEAINTPEAQLQRLQAERLAETQSRTQQEAENRIQAQAQSFVNYLVPKFEALVSQNPTVTFDEVFGRYSLLTAPLLQNGRIPPDRFQAVDQIVDTELASYVASLNQTRSTQKKQQTATVADAKRQMARAVAPRGTTPSLAPPKPQSPKNYSKATDIFADIPNLVGQAVA